MSLPPTLVQIKRKRTDEPVEFLRIQETNGKRQRTIDGYIFERQAPLLKSNPANTTTPIHLAARAIKPLHRSGSAQNIAVANPPSEKASVSPAQAVVGSGVGRNVEQQQRNETETHLGSATGHSPNKQSPHSGHPRRFHISRAPSSQEANGTSLRKKTKDSPIVFIERRARLRKLDAPSLTQVTKNIAVPDTSAARPQKRPGKNARTQLPPSSTSEKGVPPSTEKKPDIPAGLRNRWNVTPEQLAQEMEAYTLQTIGVTLAEQNAQKPPAYDARSGQGLSKFKPKAPALRYAERNPQPVVQDELNDAMDYEVDGDEVDAEDFVTETYIRVPLNGQREAFTNVGLLVLDSQPDIDEFYGDSEDSEEDDDDDDEDENAENHYSADYPDEEVDSDDEFGRNAYNYRHNGSDDEFDTSSDSDDDTSKAFWRYKHRQDRTSEYD